MPFMRMKMIELVELKKVNQFQFVFSSSSKYFNQFSPYDLFFEITPYETGESEKVSISSCSLRFLREDDKKKSVSHYLYKMQEQDRRHADLALKKFWSELDAGGWDVSVPAESTLTFFDKPKSYQLFSYSHIDRKYIPNPEMKEEKIKEVYFDVLLYQEKGG